jgi:two-component system heavy metal sensor histidine kinase CusS
VRTGTHSPRGRSLRGQLTRSLALALGAWCALTFAIVMALQARALGRQLDASLRAHAASEVLTAIDRPDGRAHLHDAPLPVVDEQVALEKFAALYDAQGTVLAHTSSFAGAVPSLAALPRDAAFDLRAGGRALRAVTVPMGEETPARLLLLAVPRAGLDAALRTLVSVGALAFVLALALAFVLARTLAGRLTRDLEAITATARAVAEGDLAARVGPIRAAEELQALGHDLDEMIARLAALMATQRRFVSDAAHELRSPLTSLRGELELALRRPREAAAYREALTRALRDTIELAALADDLLSLARARTVPSTAECTAVAPVLERVTAQLGGTAAARGVQLAQKGAAGRQAAIGARDLERVVRNLVENALRHAPAGSTVQVVVGTEAEQLSLAVEDAGPGVPPEQAERVFEPFVRLDPARGRDAGGAGLGLAIAREIARAHGGDVELAPRPGIPGGRFVLRLPEGDTDEVEAG